MSPPRYRRLAKQIRRRLPCWATRVSRSLSLRADNCRLLGTWSEGNSSRYSALHHRTVSDINHRHKAHKLILKFNCQPAERQPVGPHQVGWTFWSIAKSRQVGFASQSNYRNRAASLRWSTQNPGNAHQREQNERSAQQGLPGAPQPENFVSEN